MSGAEGRSTAARRLAVRVTPDALRHVRAGHPWIFEDSVVSVKPDGGTWLGGHANLLVSRGGGV